MFLTVPTRSWWPLLLVALGVGLMSGASAEAAGGFLFGQPWHWGEMALRLVLTTLLLPPTWRLAWVAIDREWVPRGTTGIGAATPPVVRRVEP